jgi:hypothetical protein
MNTIIERAKARFMTNLDQHGTDPWRLEKHLEEAERWANRLLPRFSSLDREVIELSIWLHDIGHYPVVKGEDHAVVSEAISREFLAREKYDPVKQKKVLHCVRSHRNKDVVPQSPEAKFFAMLDSISHFTYAPYVDMAIDGRIDQAIEKLERDYRDISPFSEIQLEIKGLYESWKKLLLELKNWQ